MAGHVFHDVGIVHLRAVFCGGIDEGDTVGGVPSCDFDFVARDAEDSVRGELVVLAVGSNVHDLLDRGGDICHAFDFDFGVLELFAHEIRLGELEEELVILRVELLIGITESSFDLRVGGEIACVDSITVAELVGHLTKEEVGVELHLISGGRSTSAGGRRLADLPHAEGAVDVDSRDEVVCVLC